MRCPLILHQKFLQVFCSRFSHGLFVFASTSLFVDGIGPKRFRRACLDELHRNITLIFNTNTVSKEAAGNLASGGLRFHLNGSRPQNVGCPGLIGHHIDRNALLGDSSGKIRFQSPVEVRGRSWVLMSAPLRAAPSKTVEPRLSFSWLSASSCVSIMEHSGWQSYFRRPYRIGWSAPGIPGQSPDLPIVQIVNILVQVSAPVVPLPSASAR